MESLRPHRIAWRLTTCLRIIKIDPFSQIGTLRYPTEQLLGSVETSNCETQTVSLQHHFTSYQKRSSSPFVPVYLAQATKNFGRLERNTFWKRKPPKILDCRNQRLAPFHSQAALSGENDRQLNNVQYMTSSHNRHALLDSVRAEDRQTILSRKLQALEKEDFVIEGSKEFHRADMCKGGPNTVALLKKMKTSVTFKATDINDCRREQQTMPQSSIENKGSETAASYMDDVTAYVALGSNVGNRVKNIEAACFEMRRRGISIVRTSGLYETNAMYVTDQPSFLNGVCEVKLNRKLSPQVFLAMLKKIENDLGRQKTVEKGPRSIDLDIILYADQVVEQEDLSIPHKAMLEREFVLRPLCDLIPNDTLPFSPEKTSFRTHLRHLPEMDPSITTITPLNSTPCLLSPLRSTRPTHVMVILNLTPDSFSDGSLHSFEKPDTLIPLLRSYLHSGASILDIGGQSTRPNASLISSSEELSRILPTIRLIRSLPEFESLVISVDTFHASVAAAALQAGADVINDVSAGTMDLAMFRTVAKAGASIILMHMRGTPATMKNLTSYPNGLLPTVAAELRARIAAAEAAGIFRWRMLLDPGIGFAKNQAQNLELLRRLDALRDMDGLQGLPWVVGASRKGFIGTVTGVAEPAARGWGTAACVAASVRGGADVVRVHDVPEMVGVVRMADAIYRV